MHFTAGEQRDRRDIIYGQDRLQPAAASSMAPTSHLTVGILKSISDGEVAELYASHLAARARVALAGSVSLEEMEAASAPA